MGRLTLEQIERTREAHGHSVLLFLTDRCPVGCAHCSVDSRADSPTITDFELFEKIVDGICALPEVRVVGISGGEPFVERRGLLLATERIVDSGKDVVVYTSGVWATRPEAPAWVRKVLGLSSCAFLSTDAFHAAQMQDERFVRAARAIAGVGVWIVVQVLELEDMVAKAESLLHKAFGADYADFAELNLTPPLPYGRGASVFMRTKHTPGHAFGPCRLVAAPVIRYDGLVSACCNENVIMGGGPERLRRRTATADELTTAVGDFLGDPLVRAIGGVGPGPMTGHPRFADLADEQFTSICQLCWRMLERTEQDEQPDRLVRALDLVGRAR